MSARELLADARRLRELESQCLMLTNAARLVPKWMSEPMGQFDLGPTPSTLLWTLSTIVVYLLEHSQDDEVGIHLWEQPAGVAVPGRHAPTT